MTINKTIWKSLPSHYFPHIILYFIAALNLVSKWAHWLETPDNRVCNLSGHWERQESGHKYKYLDTGENRCIHRDTQIHTQTEKTRYSRNATCFTHCSVNISNYFLLFQRQLFEGLVDRFKSSLPWWKKRWLSLTSNTVWEGPFYQHRHAHFHALTCDFDEYEDYSIPDKNPLQLSLILLQVETRITQHNVMSMLSLPLTCGSILWSIPLYYYVLKLKLAAKSLNRSWIRSSLTPRC